MGRLALILDCAGQVWRVGLGDPDRLGLVLTAGYLLATLAMLAVVLSRAATMPRERLLWGLATLAVLVLALNKQLDIQLILLQVGRCVARINDTPHLGCFQFGIGPSQNRRHRLGSQSPPPRIRYKRPSRLRKSFQPCDTALELRKPAIAEQFAVRTIDKRPVTVTKQGP